MEKIIEFKGAKYLIRSDGKIFSTYNGRELATRLDDDGYLCVTLGSKKNRSRVRVHNIIAKTFLTKPNDIEIFEVNHKDCDKTNPALYNLEYLTHKDNVKYAFDSGTKSNIGSKNPRTDLVENDIIEIRKLYKNGLKIFEICKKYDKPWTTISNIVKYITWKHIL